MTGEAFDISAFDFALPPRFIAERPAVPRDSARLLDVGGTLRDHRVRDLPALLAPGDVMVFNDTRVIPARLVGRRGRARIEITLHRQTGAGRWRAFARPARRLRPGDTVIFATDFEAEITDRGEGGEVGLRFARTGARLMALLEKHGQMPLPPYIKRPPGGDVLDREDYQTIFAARDGAVAAPTAGLHFTPALIAALDRRGVARVTVTLHVGAGTFLPIRSQDIRDHVMHAEYGRISAEAARTINAARKAGGRVVAVGSTSLRLLESAVGARGGVRRFAGETDIFITPGYQFRTVDLLLTNFHLPRSTLLVLVAAFAGRERVRAAYAHAMANGYRFYSYGDCCLLYPEGAI